METFLTILTIITLPLSVKITFIVLVLLIVLIRFLYFRTTEGPGTYWANSVKDTIIGWGGDVKNKNIGSDGIVDLKHPNKNPLYNFLKNWFGLYFMGWALFPERYRFDFKVTQIGSVNNEKIQIVQPYENPYAIPESFVFEFISDPIELLDGTGYKIRLSIRMETTDARELHELDRNETWMNYFNGVFNEMVRNYFTTTGKTYESVLAIHASYFEPEITTINSEMKRKGLQIIPADFKVQDPIPNAATQAIFDAKAHTEVVKAENRQLELTATAKKNAGLEENKIVEDKLRIENNALGKEVKLIGKLSAEQSRSWALSKHANLNTYAEGTQVRTNV